MFGFIFEWVDGISSVGHFVLCVVLVFICVLVYVAWCCSALLVCVGRVVLVCVRALGFAAFGLLFVGVVY